VPANAGPITTGFCICKSWGRYPIQQLTMVVMGPRFRVDDAGYGASF